MADQPLDRATVQVNKARHGVPAIKPFFDEATSTIAYVVYDTASRHAAIIDSVLDFDPASGRTSFSSANKIIAFAGEKELIIDWLLETHVHADHLSAAPYLQQKLGGKIAIGAQVVTVQETFGKLFNAGPDFKTDGSDFDRLFADGDKFNIGDMQATVLHVPGHTPACIAYVIVDAVFVGDTLFMPDYGTARCDFPGGDARSLYRSIRRILSLPPETRLFMCHDYKAPERDYIAWETTVDAQRKTNIHIHDNVTEDAFVAMREGRDAGLGMPVLILPSVQVNMRAGHLPPPEDNDVRYLKIPLNLL